MKKSIKKILPEPVIKSLGDSYDYLIRLKDMPAAYLHNWRRDSVRKLKIFHNKYQGERCFIIGNGPSLKQTDLKKLKNEYTFGMNRFYMAYEEIGFSTSFYLTINDLVAEQCAADINELDIPKFVSWRARKWLQNEKNLHFLYTSYTGPRFAENAEGRLWEGATVTNIALQLAFHMGFEQVILIGVDHNFATKGKPNTTIVSDGDDPNHFNPGYFGKGFRWQLPDLETSEVAYLIAREAYEKAGREVLDATVGGKLQVFPKVDYESLFK
ncbi:MAG: DUF115 domain-containing protein [Anaerolineaceae bacterium]|nr:DUF115 domain-containing protein [Anaerolineaceae bacterium]